MTIKLPLKLTYYRTSFKWLCSETEWLLHDHRSWWDVAKKALWLRISEDYRGIYTRAYSRWKSGVQSVAVTNMQICVPQGTCASSTSKLHFSAVYSAGQPDSVNSINVGEIEESWFIVDHRTGTGEDDSRALCRNGHAIQSKFAASWPSLANPGEPACARSAFLHYSKVLFT